MTTPTSREETDVGISSLIDTWIEVRDLELNGERNRALYMLKSRGMRHSNQVRELLISDSGMALADVFYGPEGVLIGSAKMTETKKRARDELHRQEDAARNEHLLELKKETVEAQISTLRAEFAVHEAEIRHHLRASQDSAHASRTDRDTMSQLRNDAGRATSANGGRG